MTKTNKDDDERLNEFLYPAFSERDRDDWKRKPKENRF